MSRVVAGDDPVTDLLLVMKPTAAPGTITVPLATHKGGAVISMGDVSYLCLTGWLTLKPNATASERLANTTACNQAAAIP